MKIEKMIEQHEKMWAAFEKLNEKLEEKQAPYEPKGGEYYVSELKDLKWICILNRIGSINYDHVSYNVDCGILCFLSTTGKSHKLRPATPEEKQLLDDKLKEQGKRWNAEKKQIEDIPTWKVGDWFIPHKPKVNKTAPVWADDMDEYNGKALKVQNVSTNLVQFDGWLFQFDWCEKTEAPKKEPKIGDMCIFWHDNKKNAICAILVKVECSVFMDNYSFIWTNCIPFESIEQYKKFINEEC